MGKTAALGVIFLCFITVLLTSCSSIGISTKPQKSSTLKILLSGSQQMNAFNRDFGNPYLAEHRNTEIKYVSMPNQTNADHWDQLIAVIEREAPDVLILGETEYSFLAGENRLLTLEPYVKKDGFDLENLHQPIIEKMRQIGNGTLYGLAPTFSTRALVYNKDVFDRYGVEYPKDAMTWEELLQLAERFQDPSDPNLFGFYDWGGPELLIEQIARTNGLLLFDGGEPLPAREQWIPVWSMVADAYRHRAIPEDSSQDYFKNGSAAMAIMDSGSIYKQFRKAWGIAPFPVNPEERNRTKEYYFSFIASVNEASANQELAWNFIRYLGSEQFAKAKGRSIDELFTRVEYSRTFADNDISVLYEAELSTDQDLYAQSELTTYREAAKIEWELRPEYIRKVINGQMTVEEALSDIAAKMN